MLIPGLVLGRILLGKLREAATAPAAQAGVAQLSTQAGRFRVSASVRASALERHRRRRAEERDRLAAGLRQSRAAYTTQPPPADKAFRSRRAYEVEEREEQGLEEELCDNEAWLPIYRFSHIRLYTLFAIIKFQLSGVIFAVPLFAAFNGGWSQEDMMGWAGVGVISLLSLAMLQRVTTRLIGVISLHESRDLVRIGYLNFWGRRRNAIVPVQHIVPFADYFDPAKIHFLDMKVDLLRYGAQGALFLPTFGAEIVDAEAFEYVFGPNALSDAKRLAEAAKTPKEKKEQ